jgi:cobalt-zinc-cadmium efflux system protein
MWDAVRDRVAGLPGAQAVRDLHVWTIASGLVALSAHVTVERPPRETLHDLQHDLEARFGIHHVTIQFDPPGEEADHAHAPRI